MDAPNARLGWIALALAIFAVSWSSIYVRWADVGPLASAFWRMAFALPVLWAWTRASVGRSPRSAPVDRRVAPAVAAAGVLFAADLGLFHAALGHTSVANAAFIGATASVFAVLGGLVFFREMVSARVWGALALSLAGVWVMGGWRGLSLGPGDALALGAAVVYAAYVLAIKVAGQGAPAAEVMFRSSVVTCAILLVAAAIWEERLLPQTLAAWAPLVALGVVSHALGQGMNAVALRHLPVAPISLAFLTQPAITAALAYLALGEAMTGAQWAGAAMICVALLAIRRR